MSSPPEERDRWTRPSGWEGWSILFSFEQGDHGGGARLLKSTDLSSPLSFTDHLPCDLGQVAQIQILVFLTVRHRLVSVSQGFGRIRIKLDYKFHDIMALFYWCIPSSESNAGNIVGGLKCERVNNE